MRYEIKYPKEPVTVQALCVHEAISNHVYLCNVSKIVCITYCIICYDTKHISLGGSFNKPLEKFCDVNMRPLSFALAPNPPSPTHNQDTENYKKVSLTGWGINCDSKDFRDRQAEFEG